MARLTWDETGNRLYETGVKHGVFYPVNGAGNYWNGIAWNGLTQVSENSSGAESTALYADDIKYLNLLSVEEFKGTIEAHAYPITFSRCLGRVEIARGIVIGQQERKKFGFSYQTSVGNDLEGSDYAYKIHLVYGAKVSPSSESFQTMDDSPEAITFSWEFVTEPIEVSGQKPTAHLILDGSIFRKRGLINVLHALEDILYGTDTASAKLPFPNEIKDQVELHRYLRDSNGDAICDSNNQPIESFVIR